jgi:hypothetical protein
MDVKLRPHSRDSLELHLERRAQNSELRFNDSRLRGGPLD